ncbi:MAG: hypothetical protein KIT20_12710, partial [Alphaproteobacteria bacterium]|nr:hypothetical protein [Alphaproteobacteria bacterium]
MTRDELQADLAFVRTLAEEGREAPLLGGAHCIFWGLLTAGAFAIHGYLMISAPPEGNGPAFALLWGAFGILSTIGGFLLRRRVCTLPGLASIGVQAERRIWSAAGAGLFMVALGAIARMLLEQDYNAPNIIPGVGFAFYGAALLATAHLSRHVWLG